MKAFEGILDSDSNCNIRVERLIHRDSSIRLALNLHDRRAGLSGGCDLSMNRLGTGFERQRTSLCRGGSQLPHSFSIQFTDVKIDEEDEGLLVQGSFEWNGSAAPFTGRLTPFQSPEQHEQRSEASPQFTYTNWFNLPETQPARVGAYQVYTRKWGPDALSEVPGDRAKRLSECPKQYAYWDGTRFGPTTKTPALAKARHKQTRDFNRVLCPTNWRGLTRNASSTWN